MTKNGSQRRPNYNAKRASYEIERVPHLDGGWGWAVCAGACMVHLMTVGQQNVAGVVYSELVDEFDSNRAETAWVTALASSIMYFFAPFSTYCGQRWGCRKVVIIGGLISALGLVCCSFPKTLSPLYLTYGVMWGIGTSLGLFPSLVMLTKYFRQRLALVTGMSLSGAAIGTLVFGPLLRAISSRFGVPNMFRIFAGLNVLTMISGLLYRPLPGESKLASYVGQARARTKMDWSLFKNKGYLLWMAALCTFMLVFMVPFVHLVKLAEDMNIGKTAASLLTGYMAIGALIGSLVFGRFSDSQCCNRLVICQFALLAIGVSSTLVTAATSYAGLAIYAFIFGLFDGCYEMLVPVITSDIVGIRQTPHAIGTLYCVLALPKTVGPPVAGWIFDVSKSYAVAFYVTGAVSIVAALLMFFIPIFLDDKNPRETISANSSASDMKPLKGSEVSSLSEEAKVVKRSNPTPKKRPGVFACYTLPFRCAGVGARPFSFYGIELDDDLFVTERETCV